MKKAVFLSLCFLLALAGCKKSGDTPNNQDEVIPPGISATIDGTPVSFNAYTLADTGYNGTFYLSVVGRTATSPPYDQMVISILGPTPPRAGTYQHQGTAGVDYAILLYGLGSTSYIEDYTSTASQHPVTINVTKFTTTNVQGTFSGKLVLPGATATGLKTITDGKFNINF